MFFGWQVSAFNHLHLSNCKGFRYPAATRDGIAASELFSTNAARSSASRVVAAAEATRAELTFAGLDIDYAKLKIQEIITCPALPAFEKARKAGKLLPNVPFIFKGSPVLTKAHAEALGSFLKEFKSSKQYTKPGRGAQTADWERRPLENGIKGFRDKAEHVLSTLSQPLIDYLQVPWMFGYSPVQKSAGPEFSHSGSLEW